MRIATLTRDVNKLRRQANELIHMELETEMFRIMHMHPSIESMCKGMGTLALRNLHGGYLFDDEWPRFCRKLQLLVELDTDYYSLTDHPLKICRGTDGQVLHTRRW